jgi:hypothetical protein
LTVVEGNPASVFLSLPAGTSFGDDAGSSGTPQAASKREEREHRRRRRERNADAVDVYQPPEQAAPPKASP